MTSEIPRQMTDGSVAPVDGEIIQREMMIKEQQNVQISDTRIADMQQRLSEVERAIERLEELDERLVQAEMGIKELERVLAPKTPASVTRAMPLAINWKEEQRRIAEEAAYMQKLADEAEAQLPLKEQLNARRESERKPNKEVDNVWSNANPNP